MNRVLLIGGIIYLLFLAGLATLSGELLLLTLPLLLYLGAGLLYAPGNINLHIERSVDPERAASNTPSQSSFRLITWEGVLRRSGWRT